MLKSVELLGFKSFGKRAELVFHESIAAIVGPNGSGKSNVAEALRFVLGEQSMKSLRSRKGEDLIWGGSGAVPRMSRASVKVLFDNRAKRLDVDFDEVVLERVVYRDGQNEYLLNGTQVRLKDVVRLLAGAHIGGSGYQIISQGEADRVLSASARERRAMVEDALGLKLYQHKKAESERKLEETLLNAEKVQSLRRELAPHLTFLRKQMERVEKVREYRDALREKLQDYLAREHAWIHAQEVQGKDDLAVLREEEHALSRKREEAMRLAAQQKEGMVVVRLPEREVAENAFAAARAAREEAARSLGRAEGALSTLSRADGPASIPSERAGNFARIVLRFAEVALETQDPHAAREQIAHIREEAHAFLGALRVSPERNKERAEAEFAVATLARTLADAEEEERAQRTRVDTLRAEEAALQERSRGAEREVLLVDAQLRELLARIREVERRLSDANIARQAFEEEVREGIALIGALVHGWESGLVPEGALSEPRHAQEERRRAIERVKIKIEEAGVGNGEDIVKEYTTTRERDEFLARELSDLLKSETTLRRIIEELDQEMDRRFVDGLSHINAAFAEFFTRLFGGGEARLSLEKPGVDEDAESDGAAPIEEAPILGLEVSVQLPRKKVRGLEVLSGGERALTSIALIFAMSQVNPPPFLILDETDAALDEANSKRYADILKVLAERSQLIVITHNRATMAAAGELYGVTMGQDGVSKLLSVKLAEAERVAK